MALPPSTDAGSVYTLCKFQAVSVNQLFSQSISVTTHQEGWTVCCGVPNQSMHYFHLQILLPLSFHIPTRVDRSSMTPLTFVPSRHAFLISNLTSNSTILALPE